MKQRSDRFRNLELPVLHSKLAVLCSICILDFRDQNLWGRERRKKLENCLKMVIFSRFKQNSIENTLI